MTFLQARARARTLFPTWSRRMRAKWVIARLKVTGPRIEIGGQSGYDPTHYYFARTAR